MRPGWDELLAAARKMTALSYAPYSSYPVGAAGAAEDGRIVTGCNVENASYGLTSQLVATGGGRLVALCCVDASAEVIMPCGRCRQLLWEHGGAELEVMTPLGARPLGQLLPLAFGSEDLMR